jgi:hypothetical protein
MFQPALIGGLVSGALSVLPVVSIFNLCCCLWVVTGGGVAAYMLQQKRSAPITPGDGAVVGLLAGLIGSVVYLVLSLPVFLIMGSFQQQILDQVMNNPEFPPELQQFLATGATGFLFTVIGFFFMLAAGIVFSTLGGLLGALIFRKSQPPVPYTGPQM